MHEADPPAISQLLDEARLDPHALRAQDDAGVILRGNAPHDAAGSTDRRSFITRASTLSLAVPGLAALAACNPQSEFYLADAANGLRAPDYTSFWVVNAGPTHPSNFHVVGEQFDTMYLGVPPGTPVRGVQTWDVAPGGGMIFELVCDVPGEFPFVNHGFGHGQKGGVGLLVVE